MSISRLEVGLRAILYSLKSVENIKRVVDEGGRVAERN